MKGARSKENSENPHQGRRLATCEAFEMVPSFQRHQECSWEPEAREAPH